MSEREDREHFQRARERFLSLSPNYWDEESDGFTLTRGFAQLRVEVKTPLNPDEAPIGLVTLRAIDSPVAMYMQLDEKTWDDLAWRIEDLRSKLYDRRPIATCRDITQGQRPGMGLHEFDLIMRQHYEPAIRAHINAHAEYLRSVMPHKLTLWERLKHRFGR